MVQGLDDMLNTDAMHTRDIEVAEAALRRAAQEHGIGSYQWRNALDCLKAKRGVAPRRQLID